MAKSPADIFELEGLFRQSQSQRHALLVEDIPCQSVCISPLLTQLGHGVSVTDQTIMSMLKADNSPPHGQVTSSHATITRGKESV